MKTILFLLLSFTCHAQQQAVRPDVTLEYIGDPFEVKSSELKYDTTKIVILVSDTTDVYPTQHQIHENHFITIKPTSPNWMYGYVIIKSEYCMIACPDDMPGCCVVHYGYGNKKTIGYLDLSKNPISKEIIIWDWTKVD